MSTTTAALRENAQKSDSAKISQGEAGDEIVEKLSLKDSVSTLLEEARMVLPGLQALFGFELIVVFNGSFQAVAEPVRMTHWVAILLTLLAIALLLTPAAYDRLTGHRHVHESFVRLSTRLIAIAMVPFMTALTLESYVVTLQITSKETMALGTAIATFLTFGVLWYVFPMIAHASRHAGEKRETDR